MSDHTSRPAPDANDLKINLTRLAVPVAMLAALVGLLGAWFVLPYRLTVAERKIEAVEMEQRQQREILIRIDENVKQLKAATK